MCWSFSNLLFDWLHLCHSQRDGGSELEVDFCLILLGVLQTHLELDTGPESRKLMCKMMFLEHSGTVAVGLNTGRTGASSILLLKWNGKAMHLRGWQCRWPNLSLRLQLCTAPKWTRHKQELVQIPCGRRKETGNSWTKSYRLKMASVDVTETGTLMSWAAMRTAEKYWQRD